MKQQSAATEAKPSVSASQLPQVVSRGRSGEQVIGDYEDNDKSVGYYAKQVLRSVKFVATDGKVYNPVIIDGNDFSEDDRTNANIWAEGARRKYPKPPAELASLLGEKFATKADIKATGYDDLVVMSDPIAGQDGYPLLLGLCSHEGSGFLDAYDGHSDGRWGVVNGRFGFVFLAPQE
jgi:hypothetical protein